MIFGKNKDSDRNRWILHLPRKYLPPVWRGIKESASNRSSWSRPVLPVSAISTRLKCCGLPVYIQIGRRAKFGTRRSKRCMVAKEKSCRERLITAGHLLIPIWIFLASPASSFRDSLFMIVMENHACAATAASSKKSALADEEHIIALFVRYE